MTDIRIREAGLADIGRMQVVRNAVKENQLPDPALVTDADVAGYLTQRGKGWVAETGNRIVGFAIADLQGHSIWALFMHPEFEKQGTGSLLHHTMLNWYFGQTSHPVWLSTSPGTRAEQFYRKAGWVHAGRHGKNELKFTLSRESWQKRTSRLS